ncbi:claudin-23-like [Pholidichthys leucotaenia]
MPFWRRSHREYVPKSQRTPGVLIFGLVMAPCGWILNLTATVSPNWRTIGDPVTPPLSADQFLQQGIFDICIASDINTRTECGQQDPVYFSHQIIDPARGLMVGSLVVTLVGLAVAIPGVRCWKEKPNWVVAGLGGILIFCSGVLVIIPIAWYNHIFLEINTTSTSDLRAADVRVGYCIVLGYIGAIFMVLGGPVMVIGMCRCCGGWNRGEQALDKVLRQQQPPPRHVHVPPSLSRARSNASSVPYSKESLDDDVSFPRAKTPSGASANSVNSRPFDADL